MFIAANFVESLIFSFLDSNISKPAINTRKSSPKFAMNSISSLISINLKPFGPIIIPAIINNGTDVILNLLNISGISNPSINIAAKGIKFSIFSPTVKDNLPKGFNTYYDYLTLPFIGGKYMDDIRKAMEKFGVPGRDCYDLPTSKKTFPDGANYRIEISGIERPSTLHALIDEMEKRDVPVHRLISMVMGSTYLTDDDLEEFAKTASEKNLEVIITPGPRGGWDTGRQLATPEGCLSGLRVRGSDNLSYLIADIKRTIDFGFRGFLVTDEGVLWLLSKLREAGELPKETVFKISIYAGHANAAGGKVLEMLGADTFNPLGDLTLPMFASIRKAVNIPIDVHIILSESFGGYTRFWEAPELARVTSPCYFKIEPGTALAAPGGIYKPWTDEGFLANLAREKVKFAETIIKIIEKHQPDLKLSKVGPKDLAIPKV